MMLRALLLHHGFKQAETFALIARSDVQLDPFGQQPCLTTLTELESRMQNDGGPFIVKPQDSGMGFGVALVSAENGSLTRRRGTRFRSIARASIPRRWSSGLSRNMRRGKPSLVGARTPCVY